MIRAFVTTSIVLAGAAACAPAAAPPRLGAPVASTGAWADARPTTDITLRLCPGVPAYNVGPVTIDGLAADFTPAIRTAAGDLLRNPTEGACISSGYGHRPAAIGGGREHKGLDLAGRRGSYILAAGPGRVVSAGWAGSFGLYVEIDHGRGVRTRYGHMMELNPAVAKGAVVEAGQAIGRMGATGNATGVHLHYEVIAGGRQVDPLTYGRAAEAPPGA